MKEVWHHKEMNDIETFIIAGDIGGTNTNLGLVGVTKKQLKLLFEIEISSPSVTDFITVVKDFISRFSHLTGGRKPTLCCIGAKGLVKDQLCVLHNLSWQVDGKKLQEVLGIPTLVINDFMSVSYAVPLIDVNDPKQVRILNPGAGSSGLTKAVIGAGTGLGVGLILQTQQGHAVLPSEGGNIDFSPFDTDTDDLRKHFHTIYGETPSFELFCSGIGLRNLFSFALEKGWVKEVDPVISQIQHADDIPRALSQHAATHSGCRKIFDTFIRIYARFASSIATLFLPTGGLYLAGGIGSKNLPYFLENDLFVETYKHKIHTSYADMPQFLASIPVYMILNYNTALLGSANAALNMLK